MNKTKADKISRDVVKLLAAFANEHGYRIAYAGGRFSTTEFTLKLKVTEISDSGEILTRERQCLKNNFPELFDKIVQLESGPARLVEYHSRKHKFPVIAETRTGKRYKLPLSYAQRLVKEAA